MPAEPGGSSTGGQGKAVPVEETAVQLELPVATAEDPRGATRATTPDRSGAGRAGVPEATVNAEKAASATMEEVAGRLPSAVVKVVSNKGAPGPDGQTIDELREQWAVIYPGLRADLLAGSYRPGVIRRADIPKAGGGQRGLGIPNVIDRVVMEAVRQVLEPLFEPTFHPSSHGFRPGRSCHTAVAEAGRHLQDGYECVVDLDLEKFFDRVCHQRLMAKLAGRVGDRRLLVLIGRMLKARVVLPDGVVIDIEEGVPQGSPLSPLLSNVVLDELDRELARRGHRFVRYADDANVYVRSERAGLRVMASLERFIGRRLRLKINHDKSAVARPEDRHSSASGCGSIRRPGPSRFCSPSAPSATPESRSASSHRDSGEARLRAASPASTCGLSGGTASSGSPRPARSSRCARSTPTSGAGCAPSCCATGNADGRSHATPSPWESNGNQRGDRSTRDTSPGGR
jgi:group II intron reverse transcriptase/maturase